MVYIRLICLTFIALAAGMQCSLPLEASSEEQGQTLLHQRDVHPATAGTVPASDPAAAAAMQQPTLPQLCAIGRATCIKRPHKWYCQLTHLACENVTTSNEQLNFLTGDPNLLAEIRRCACADIRSRCGGETVPAACLTLDKKQKSCLTPLLQEPTPNETAECNSVKELCNKLTLSVHCNADKACKKVVKACAQRPVFPEAQ